MGIFSDKCVNKECRGRVPKSAKFCRLCGSAAADADTNCGRCGATVATSSKFCWRCGVNLGELKKTPLFDNRWVREEDDFAIRVDECDVKGFLTKGLTIEHGTKAMIFQQGRFCGYVDAGSYDVNGFLRKVNHFNQTTPTSVVLTDAGDVQIHLEAIKLYSADQMNVDAIFKSVVRLNDPEKFYTNAFKGRNTLTRGYLAESIMMELRSALQTYVGSHSVDELYNNPQLRTEVQRQMQLELEPVLERVGLEMVQLRFVDFFCPDYDQIRQQQADLYLDTRKADIDIDRLKLAQRLRREMNVEKMDTLKSETDFENFVRQTEHELGLKDVIRDDEMERLKRQFVQNRDKDILTHQIEIEGIRSEAGREEARKKLDADIEAFKKKKHAQREDKVADASAGREVRSEDHDQDMKEALDAVGLRERNQEVELKKQTQEQKLEAEKLKARSEASAQALLSILDGDEAERIMKLEQLRAKQELTPEQIIAMTAAESPHVAQVLAEKYKAEAAISEDKFSQMETFMAQQQATNRESSDRLERVMNMALQQMGTAATARGQAQGPGSQTVVTPGGVGGGSPVVINPSAASQEKPCPKCKDMIPSDSRFCPNCSHKV